MSVAALSGMNSFVKPGEKWMRWIMFAHGIIAHFIGGVLLYPTKILMPARTAGSG